jgi:hypothetical protein
VFSDGYVLDAMEVSGGYDLFAVCLGYHGARAIIISS